MSPEDISDSTQGQVVNITNVGDRVFVTVRHHYYDDFDNPILDDRAMRPYEIVYEGSMEDLMLNNYTNSRGQEITFEATNYDFSQIDKILQDMDEDDSIQLTNTDGSEVRNKALNIYENIRTVQDGIKQLKEENAETFRIDALENYLLRLKYDLDNELNRWAWENMNAEEFGATDYNNPLSTRHWMYELQFVQRFINKITYSMLPEHLHDALDKSQDIMEDVVRDSLKAEEFEATKGIDTYAQPFEEMKIGSTTKKVATLIAAMIGGGAIYSHFTKRGE